MWSSSSRVLVGLVFVCGDDWVRGPGDRLQVYRGRKSGGTTETQSECCRRRLVQCIVDGKISAFQIFKLLNDNAPSQFTCETRMLSASVVFESSGGRLLSRPPGRVGPRLSSNILPGHVCWRRSGGLPPYRTNTRNFTIPLYLPINLLVVNHFNHCHPIIDNCHQF